MLLVAVAELPLAQRAPLPCLKGAGDVREEAETVIGGHDRHADHVAERNEHEERFHGGADLERLLRVLVAEHPVKEFPDRLRPAKRSPGGPTCKRRSCSWSRSSCAGSRQAASGTSERGSPSSAGCREGFISSANGRRSAGSGRRRSSWFSRSRSLPSRRRRS